MNFNQFSTFRYGWQTQFIQNFTNDANTSTHSTVIGNLTQNTQYAYYVKTQVARKEHEEKVLRVSQGLSNIQYFRTKAEAPTMPIVETLSKTDTSITLTWSPTDDNDLIEWYKVDMFIQPDEHDVLDSRDYCLNPRIETHVSVGIEVSPSTIYQSCNTEFENFKIANPNSIDPEYDWQIHRKAECAERASRQAKEENQSQILKYVNNHKILNCGDDKKCHERARFTREIHNFFTNDGIDNRNKDDSIDKLDLGKYYIQTIWYPKNQLKATFLDLLPYTMYIFQFFSCNVICSTYYFSYERTDSSIYADDVPSLTVSIDPYNSNQVHLDFIEPITPNGLTVAFHIEQYDFTNAKLSTFCMPWKQYISNGKR